MLETMGTFALIVWLFIFIAALSLPLIVWRIKDLLLEIRADLRAVREALQDRSTPTR